MIFDDNFFDLTGIEKDSKEKKTENIESNGDSGLISKDESFGSGLWGNDSGVGTRIGKGPSTATWASEYGNPDFDYVIESDLVTPKVEAVASEKKRIVVVDDDFETLDLLEIFLKRDYECVTFSGPREAVFYLNQHIPDLVLIDCKIHTMKAKTFVEIARTGARGKDIPFVYLGNQEELDSIKFEEMPEGVIGHLKRPIFRGDLQEILDKTVNKDKNNE